MFQYVKKNILKYEKHLLLYFHIYPQKYIIIDMSYNVLYKAIMNV